jgi:hypothetical protein
MSRGTVSKGTLDTPLGRRLAAPRPSPRVSKPFGRTIAMRYPTRGYQSDKPSSTRPGPSSSHLNQTYARHRGIGLAQSRGPDRTWGQEDRVLRARARE